MEILRIPRMKKSRIFLLIFIISVQVAFSQNSIKDRILSGIMPQANYVTATNFAPKGNISSTIFGNVVNINYNKYYISNSKEKEKKQIISELSSSPKEKQSGDIIKKTEIDNVLNNLDTSFENYYKTCENIDFELRKKLEKDFPFAVELALKIEKIARAKNDSSQLSYIYSMLFFMYASNDFIDYAAKYEKLAHSYLNKKSVIDLKTNETYNLLSQGYYLLNDYRKVIEIEKVFVDINTKNNILVNETLARSYNLLGKIYYQKIRDNDSAILYIEKAVKILNAIPNGNETNFYSEAFYHYSILQNEKTKEIKTPMSYLKKCLEVAIQRKDSFYIAYAYHTMGYYFSTMALNDSALYYANKALSIKVKTRMIPNSIGYTLSNIGYYYFIENNFDSAYKYYSKSLVELEKDTIPDIEMKMSIKLRLGMTSPNNELYKNIDLLWQVINYNKTKGSLINWDTRASYFYLGKLYNKVKKYDIAIKCLDTAIYLTKKYDKDFQFLHHNYWERSISYSQKDSLSIAIQDIDTAIYYYHNQSSHNKNELVTLINIKADLYNKVKNSKKAIEIQFDLLQLITVDEYLFEKYYFNTIRNLSFLYFEDFENEKSVNMLFSCKDYIETNKYDTTLYIHFYSLALLAKDANNPFLCSYFMEKHNQILRKNKKIGKETLNSFLFENDLDIIESYRLNKEKKQASILYSKFKKTYKDIYKNDILKKIEIDLLFVKLNYSDSVKFDTVVSMLSNIQNEIIKNKFQITQSKYVYYMSLIYEYFIISLLFNEKYSNVGTYLFKLEELYCSTNDIFSKKDIGAKIRYLTKLYADPSFNYDDSISQNWLKKGLKYRSIDERKESIAITFFNIARFDYLNNESYEFIDSIKNYEHYLILTEYDKRFLNYLYIKSFVNMKNYNDALKVYDSVQFVRSDWFSIELELIKIYCYNSIGDLKKVDLLFNQFKMDYNEVIKNNKNKYLYLIENFLILSIKNKLTNMFSLFINDLENYKDIGIADLYKIYLTIEMGDESGGLNLLEKSMHKHNYDCILFENNSFLKKIKNTHRFQKIISLCKK